MGDQFLWRLTASSAWDANNNWTDTTASLSPPPAPPGASDGATIDGPTNDTSYFAIAGPGSAAAFAAAGDVGLAGGAFGFGTLTLASAALLNIGAATTVTAASLPALTGTLQVTGPGASLAVSSPVIDSGDITASNGATVSLAGLTFMPGGDGSLAVDPTSAIDIGPGGGPAPTAGAITVAAGVTIEEPGPIDANFAGAVIDDGIITVSGTSGFPGIDFAGPVSGSGTLVAVNHSALLFGSSVSTAIAFSGTDGLVNFEGGSIATGTISGFAPGDRLYFSNLVFDTASYAAGQVTLANNGTILGTITLAGSFAATTFLSLQDRFGDTQLELASGTAGAGATGPGAGTPSTNSFAWQPTAGGDWGDAANWLDNGAAATVAPGSNDLVTIAGSATGFQVISGQGNAQSLTVTGNVALGGLFDTGALDVGAGITGDLVLLPATAVTASSVSVGSGTLNVTGATLAVAGTLSDPGSLIVTDGGKVTAAGLTMLTLYGILVDASSIVDIGGTAGTAGFLTVEQGATILAELGTIAAPVIDNGIIIASQMDAELTFKDPVTGTGTLAIDSNPASITLDSSVAATNMIEFVGSSGTLVIAGALPAAGIAGFAIGDALVFRALSFDSVSAAPAGGGNTTLTLLADGTSVGTLSLLGGVPAGDSFIVGPAPFGGIGELVQLAPGTLGAGLAPPSAGTTTDDAYTWNSAAGGDWGNVANWTDTSAGSTTVAPGSNDSVGIDETAFQVISGQGDAATLTLGGSIVLGGIFQANSLDLASSTTVLVAAGATVTAANATIGARVLDITGTGAVVSSSGTLQFDSFGAIDASDGGTLTAPGMTTTGETVLNADSASAIEVGTADDATAGSIVIDSGAALDGGFLVSAPLIDNGVINTGSVTAQLNAPVTGDGTIVIGNDGGLDVSAPIGAGVTIEFAGATGTLDLSTTPVGVGGGDTLGNDGGALGTLGLANIAATIVGYGEGDAILLRGVTVDTATVFATGPGASELVVGNNGTVVSTLDLAGNYGGDSFITAPVFGNTDILMAAPCFATGTKLLTLDGEIAVEDLTIGTLVPAINAGPTPIKWIGHRRVDCRRHPAPHDVWPVRVRAGAFGAGVPHRDLLLSPDHAVLVDGALIPVRYLVNDATIVQEAVDCVVYWHVELERHDVMLAEGLGCESYLDTGNRHAFDAGAESQLDSVRLQARQVPPAAKGQWPL